MTILLSFAGGALAVYAAARLGLFHHLAADELDVWPQGVDEPYDEYVRRHLVEEMWNAS